MKLAELFVDEDAVSPVIGVILMVAITVILAAVIGTFVLGLGENVQDSAPQANFQFEYSEVTLEDDDATTDPLVDTTQVTITHTGGEDIEASTLSVQVDGSPAYGVADTDGDSMYEEASVPFGSGTIQTGTSTNLVFVDTDGTATNNFESSPTTITSSGSGFDQTDAVAIAPDQTVRVVWTSPSGGTSQTIGQSTVPS